MYRDFNIWVIITTNKNLFVGSLCHNTAFLIIFLVCLRFLGFDSSPGAWMRASGRSLLMPREPESCKGFWMGSRKGRNKYWGMKKRLQCIWYCRLIALCSTLPSCPCHYFRDLSMILCDPFASNTLVLSTVRNLQELLSQDALPRVRSCTQ